MTRQHTLIAKIMLLLLFLTSCAPAANQPPAQASIDQLPATGNGKIAVEESSPTQVVLPAATNTIAPAEPKAGAEQPDAATKAAESLPAADPTLSSTSTPTRKVTATTQTLTAVQWKDWPVLPSSVSDDLRAVYQRGLENGNNPHAFSVLGDCQSQPEVFMGIYDSDPSSLKSLPDQLQETVRKFNGSFDRYSPTVKDGTTEGALLWAQWNDNKEKKCNFGETPIDCELRVHRPSIVFVHIGTHYEARNRKYLSTLIEKIIDSGAVPVLVTKADNRELDERVNENLASLAVEYDLPLWNFWASVQHLPDGGMERGSDMYLSEEGLIIHRLGALQTLDTVWRLLSE